MALEALERIMMQVRKSSMLKSQNGNQGQAQITREMNQYKGQTQIAEEMKQYQGQANIAEEMNQYQGQANIAEEINQYKGQAKITEGMNQYKCKICRDTGFIITLQKNAQPLMTPCRCLEIEKVKRLWKNSGINTDSLNKTFSNFEEWSEKSREMKLKAKDYYKSFSEIKTNRQNSFLLCGSSGSGKTHIALALANNFLKKNIKVIYMPYRDVITKFKQNMLYEEYYRKTLSRYETCELLFLDDLYKGKVNETDVNIMFELVNYRYLNNLPIIVSTEFTVEKLLSFDEAIGSRIYEMSKNFIVEIEGKNNNYRLR